MKDAGRFSRLHTEVDYIVKMTSAHCIVKLTSADLVKLTSDCGVKLTLAHCIVKLTSDDLVKLTSADRLR